MIDQVDPTDEITLDRVRRARRAVEAGLYDELPPDSEPIAAIVAGVAPHCGIRSQVQLRVDYE